MLSSEDNHYDTSNKIHVIMGWFSNFMNASIGKKFLMSLTGLFLIFFLLVHLVVNLMTLLPDPTVFNAASHFMGHNPVIQIMQYVLALGFIVHIFMGIRLKHQNYASRPVKYSGKGSSYGATWASKNMIWTGVLVLAFIALHLKHYFVKIKFGGMGPNETDYELVVNSFADLPFTALYVVAFILLAVHLYHGFQSSFQSLGANHSKYTPMIKSLSTIYCVIIGLGFSAIALVHYIQSLS